MIRRKQMIRRVGPALALIGSVALAACGGGSGGGGGSASGFLGGSGMPGVANFRACDGTCQANDVANGGGASLTIQQVSTIMQQAINEATANGVRATIAVSDRSGNVLAVMEMPGAPQTVAIGSNTGNLRRFPLGPQANPALRPSALEDVPGGVNQGTADTVAAVTAAVGGNPALLAAGPISARFAAVSKAVTVAYLSSEGNAFTTETASQIIQQNFNPGVGSQPSGPLFGVQFSQLTCGDISRRPSFVVAAHGTAGPKAAPLGFSGDPGSAPLYISGALVGGVGVEVNGTYTVQTNIIAGDLTSVEARIAFAAQRSFEPNGDREARFITVINSLRYTEPGSRSFFSPALTSLMTGPPTGATLVDVFGRFQAADGIQAGTVFLARNGTSGYMEVPTTSPFAQGGLQRARILVNPAMGMAVPTAFLGENVLDPSVSANALQPEGVVTNPRSSFSPSLANGGLTMAEAATIVANGVEVATAARAQIRRGIGGPGLPFMEVNVSVVDLGGNLLAFAGTLDAPVFGTDVSVQKARGVGFFSRLGNSATPLSSGGPLVREEDPNNNATPFADMMADVELPVLGVNFQSQSIGQYAQDFRTFLGGARPNALADGTAYGIRTIGLLARPAFPDGIPNGAVFGPFSQPLAEFSPFNDGLQLDLVLSRLLVGLLVDPTLDRCTGNSLLEVRGGTQIFPGGVPIFKDGKLVGAMGISGDGVDQDDFVAFEGLQRAGIELAGNTGDGVGGPGRVGNAPRPVRADQIRVAPPGVNATNLRYASCPTTPFVANNQQNVCDDN